jgi:Uma2 family endonuclease
MATVAPPRSSPAASIVLDGVPWDDYEAMLRIVGNRKIRINYDRGRMEIMSPLQEHGNRSYLLGQMVDVLVEEFDIPVVPADPVTLRREDLEKGAEPDKHYHLRDNAARVVGKRDLDLTVDPPPDLVIEADVTSRSEQRLPIFAALGIPEVWRLDDDDLRFLVLQSDGTYRPSDRSLAFPSLTLADAARFLEEGRRAVTPAWIRGFRAFVRENLVPRG